MEVQPGELMEGRGGLGLALSTQKTHMHPSPQLSLLMMTRLHPSQTDPPSPPACYDFIHYLCGCIQHLIKRAPSGWGGWVGVGALWVVTPL